MQFDGFKATLPESVVNDTETLIKVCKAASVNIPLAERFYLKTHTPRESKNNPNPEPINYVVMPHPLGGRDYWIRKEDFPSFISCANTFLNTLEE